MNIASEYYTCFYALKILDFTEAFVDSLACATVNGDSYIDTHVKVLAIQFTSNQLN